MARLNPNTSRRRSAKLPTSVEVDRLLDDLIAEQGVAQAEKPNPETEEFLRQSAERFLKTKASHRDIQSRLALWRQQVGFDLRQNFGLDPATLYLIIRILWWAIWIVQELRKQLRETEDQHG
jgi:hypothetical protein